MVVLSDSQAEVTRKSTRSRKQPSQLVDMKVEKPAKRARTAKPKASMPQQDTLQLGLVTEKDRDAFLKWLELGKGPLKALDGTALDKKFFETLISPGIWTSTEVSKPSANVVL